MDSTNVDLPVNVRVEESKLVEVLADYAHESWALWMRYMFHNSTRNKDGTYTIPNHLVSRWFRQMSLPYSQLNVDEQASDRAEARTIIARIVNSHEGGNG